MTVDIVKADSEVKWLIGCTPDEMERALATHRTEWQSAMLIIRPRTVATSGTVPPTK